MLNRASLKLSSSKEVTISEMLPLFNQIFDMLEDQLDSTDLVSESTGGDNQYEAQQRKAGLTAAREKLGKYYAHTANNPFYSFGLSTSTTFQIGPIFVVSRRDTSNNGAYSESLLTVAFSS